MSLADLSSNVENTMFCSGAINVSEFIRRMPFKACPHSRMLKLFKYLILIQEQMQIVSQSRNGKILSARIYTFWKRHLFPLFAYQRFVILMVIHVVLITKHTSSR